MMFGKCIKKEEGTGANKHSEYHPDLPPSRLRVRRRGSFESSSEMSQRLDELVWKLILGN